MYVALFTDSRELLYDCETLGLIMLQKDCKTKTKKTQGNVVHPEKIYKF